MLFGICNPEPDCLGFAIREGKRAESFAGPMAVLGKIRLKRFHSSLSCVQFPTRASQKKSHFPPAECGFHFTFSPEKPYPFILHKNIRFP
jgi:hypothetical protein